MKIHIVAPITTPGLSTSDHFAPYARPGTSIGHSILDQGPPSVESQLDEVMAGADTVAKIMDAEAAGADAALIDCMGDPGLAAAREATSILVLGPAQTSMHVAALLALDFSIVTTSEAVVPMLSELVARYGLTSLCRSIRAVNVGVLDLSDEQRLREALQRETLRAVSDDGAHAIILGCTGMRGWSDQLAAHLDQHGYPGIPVLDPALTTLKIAEALVDLGLTPSCRTYPLTAVRPTAVDTPAVADPS